MSCIASHSTTLLRSRMNLNMKTIYSQKIAMLTCACSALVSSAGAATTYVRLFDESGYTFSDVYDIYFDGFYNDGSSVTTSHMEGMPDIFYGSGYGMFMSYTTRIGDGFYWTEYAVSETDLLDSVSYVSTYGFYSTGDEAGMRYFGYRLNVGSDVSYGYVQVYNDGSSMQFDFVGYAFGGLNENVTVIDLTAVPEPGTSGALAGLGALGLAAYLRRSRRKGN